MGRVADTNITQPAEPIRVGVGIHAGEAEARAEGYVGTAVNIAARVCSQARAGEVLVTETVRSLTRTSGRYRFTPRGRPTLRGISEPIALFAVEDASVGPSATGGPDPVGARRRVVVAIVALAFAGVVAIAAGGVLTGALGPAPGSGSPPLNGQVSPDPAGPSIPPAVGAAATSTSPTPSGAQPFHTGRLAPGTYQSTIMQPAIRFTVPAGWNGIEELPNYLEIDRLDDEDEQLAFMAPSVGYGPCSTTEFVTLPSRREDLAAWLQANRGLSVHVAGTLPLGNAEAQRLDVGLGTGCADQPNQRLFLIQVQPNGVNGDERWVVTPGPATPIYLVDAGDRTLAVLVGVPPTRLGTFLSDVKSVLSSLEVTR